MKWPWNRKPKKPSQAKRIDANEAEKLREKMPEATQVVPEAEYSLSSVLTPRELDVFGLLIRGIKMREIADALNIKYSTVNTHQKSIYKKLGINSRAECILRYGAHVIGKEGRK
jgi:DNA-binding NarL/FixJ family response regulator